jgi:hypothetical protein
MEMDIIHRSQLQTMETSVRNAREMIAVKNQLDVAANKVRDVFLKYERTLWADRART